MSGVDGCRHLDTCYMLYLGSPLLLYYRTHHKIRCTRFFLGNSYQNDRLPLYTTLDISHIWFRTRPHMCAKPHPEGVRLLRRVCRESPFRRSCFNRTQIYRAVCAYILVTAAHKIVHNIIMYIIVISLWVCGVC